MPPRATLLSLSPAFQRRLAKTPLRRKSIISTTSTPSHLLTSVSTSTRSLHTTSIPLVKQPTSSLHAKFIQAGGSDLPSPSALSALLSRLSLPADPRLHEDLLACLTHPSYNPYRPTDVEFAPQDDPTNNNDVLNALGNSLLGMFASEHLAHKFPLLPTETLKMALTAYVGPSACVSVARELGVGVRGGADAGLIGKGRGSFAAGIPVRWKRNSIKVPRIPISSRFRQFKEVEPVSSRTEPTEDGVVELQYEGESSKTDRSSPAVQEEKVTFDKVVAGTVRAFIGLIYQEQGIHAARRFVEAHFLTRHLDLASLFSFKHPKKVLSTVIQRHLTEAGVRAGDRTGYIVTRVLAESGINTINPLINIGLFLTSGIKLAEGFGSSYKMAEHRAATNALLSLFLVRGDQGRQIGSLAPLNGQLPSTVHVDFPVDLSGLARAPREEFKGDGFGGLETNEESSKRAAYEGRVAAARKTVAPTA